MQQVGESDGTHTVARHLNRLSAYASWQEASGTALVGRHVDATLTCLTTLPGAPAASRPRVSPTAARSLPTTTTPWPRPRRAGPGRARGSRPPAAGRPGQGSGTGTVSGSSQRRGVCGTTGCEPRVALGGPGRDVPARRGTGRAAPEEGFVPQTKRWKVEQTYGILILHRRLVRDYEHHPASSASRVYWAMTQVMARRLTGENTPTWRERQTVSA
ncbi:hypothetical protein PV721_19725 [Streptomyces sp. MB09-01]|nr:hypothetical protein [Streptomyces sp. MB09-01]